MLEAPSGPAHGGGSKATWAPGPGEFAGGAGQAGPTRLAQQDLVVRTSPTGALGQVGLAGLPSMVSESVFRPWPCPSLVAVRKPSLPASVSHHGACPGPPARCLVHLVLGGKSSKPEIRLPLQAGGQRKDVSWSPPPPPQHLSCC